MKTLTLILFLFTTSLFGQTNYNTIMYTKQDSTPPIDLHLKKSERISTAATILHTVGFLSLVSLYYIAPKSPIGFIVPGSIVATSIGFHFWSDREFRKSKKYLESEKD